jgi:hypothetical protein
MEKTVKVKYSFRVQHLPLFDYATDPQLGMKAGHLDYIIKHAGLPPRTSGCKGGT